MSPLAPGALREASGACIVPGDAARDRRVAVAISVLLPPLVGLCWPTVARPWGEAAPIAVAVLGALAVALLWWGSRARGLAALTVASGLGGALAVVQRPGEPEAGLVCGLALGGMLVDAFGWLAPRPIELRPSPAGVVEPAPIRWSLGASVALVAGAAALGVSSGAFRGPELAAVACLPVLAAVVEDLRAGLVGRITALSTLAAALLAAGTAAVPGLAAAEWSALVALPALIAALSARVDGRSLIEGMFVSPARLLVASFAGICLWGTVVLALGPAGARGPIPLVDAAFTAVSATCVTGLAVIDTPTGLSPFGQVVVLVLIQVGGLGMMTFAAAATVWTGRRLSLRQEATAADLLGPDARRDLVGALRWVLWVTVATELAAATVLWPCFLWHGDGPGTAAWRALFTAVSAFCNAGFALQSDSLIPYRHDPIVLGTCGLAFVVGGLGPSVIAATPRLLRGGGELHARVVWITTLALVVAPSALYALLEWNASLGGLGVPHKLTNAIFQAVTPRTAGFNSVDLTLIRPATWTLLVVLMFVGGSPGSTAGGIKTTTAAIVVLAAIGAARGHKHAVAFGRIVPQAVVLQAVAATAMGLGAGLVALVAIQLTQDLTLEVSLFEVVSALGTVGLTIGGTVQLDSVGKLIVMICMFAGRVGPVSVLVALAERRTAPEPALPEGTISVG